MTKNQILGKIVEEVDKEIKNNTSKQGWHFDEYTEGYLDALKNIKTFLDTLEVKEVDEQKERMNECPFRQVGCAMYEGHILECRGACSWVVDYPKLKELKAQKGE